MRGYYNGKKMGIYNKKAISYGKYGNKALGVWGEQDHMIGKKGINYLSFFQ